MTRHEETAKRLLPCEHIKDLPGYYNDPIECYQCKVRPPVAAALAQAEAEGETGEGAILDACAKLREQLGDSKSSGLIGSPTEVVLEAAAEIARLTARLAEAERERDEMQLGLSNGNLFAIAKIEWDKLCAARDAAEAKGVKMGLERAREIVEGNYCLAKELGLRCLRALDAEIAKAGGE